MERASGGGEDRAEFRLTWHLAAVGLLVVGPSLVLLGEPIWSLELGRAYHVLGLGGSYLAAAAVAETGGARPARSPWACIVVGVISLSGLYLVLLLGRLYYARSILLGGSVAALALLVGPTLLRRFRSPSLPGLVLAFFGALAASLALAPGTAERQDDPTVTREVNHTGHHSVRTVRYEDQVELPAAHGGGLERIGDRYLLATGDGDVYVLGWEGESDSLSVSRAGFRIPIDREAFTEDVGDDVHTPWFRVADLLVRETGDSARVVASHHVWKPERECFALRVSTFAVPWQRLVDGNLDHGGAGPGWETRYETEPCLPLVKHGPGRRFAGLRAGGRMIALDSTRLLLTVGDHGFDGWQSQEALPQDTTADYGKTLVVSPDGSAEPFTTGHRNPQGLHADGTGDIWLTEHGPEGGDELNRLVEGGNYGWPVVTHGTAYGDVEWPPGGDGDRSRAFRAPVYAWVPSIGVSAMTVLRDSAFSRWTGDLLVASLKRETLFRIRTAGDRVEYVEPIHIGKRIRDVVEGADGRIVLWTDDASIVSLRPATSSDRGAVVFRRCVGCHAAAEGQASGRGPDLDDVPGREVAAREGYPYSEALRALDGRWTRARLDSFLADPARFAPGTKMDVPGITDPGEREALIEYLERR